MSTVIFTLIGLLLVSVTVLMVMFYGSEAMAKSSENAAAQSLVNAGSNVEFATTAYRITNGTLPDTIEDLRKTVNDYQWLLEDPNVSSATNDKPTIFEHEGEKIYWVGGLTIDICMKVNKTYQRVGVIPVDMEDAKRGCLQSGRDFIYFVRLGKVSNT